MLKKIIVIVAMLMLVSFSISLLVKTKPVVEQTPESPQPVKTVEDVLPDTIYELKADSLTVECAENNKQLCAVENAIKCTLNPKLENCQQLKLPKFIFMSDQTIERPTEINYRFTNKKVLPNNTTEIYTESTCNASWFGLCQGTIIYVLTPINTAAKWHVKDIYAIE